MGTAENKDGPSDRLDLGGIGATFEMSLDNGKIVLDPLGDRSPDNGLTVTAEIVEGMGGGRVIVFKKRQHRNYRRKAARQQHTILRIVGITTQEAPASDAASPGTHGAAAENQQEERELRELAADLEGATERMGRSLDRAIGAARAALDEDREAALREHYRAEIRGDGNLVPPGIA
jgi:hypothetical protein